MQLHENDSHTLKLLQFLINEIWTCLTVKNLICIDISTVVQTMTTTAPSPALMTVQVKHQEI